MDANGLRLTHVEAGNRMDELREVFTILDEKPEVFTEWVKLVREQDVKGKAAHDARLIAAMQVHGVDHLLTWNSAHFTRYTGITVLSPDQLMTR